MNQLETYYKYFVILSWTILIFSFVFPFEDTVSIFNFLIFYLVQFLFQKMILKIHQHSENYIVQDDSIVLFYYMIMHGFFVFCLFSFSSSFPSSFDSFWYFKPALIKSSMTSSSFFLSFSASMIKCTHPKLSIFEITLSENGCTCQAESFKNILRNFREFSHLLSPFPQFYNEDWHLRIFSEIFIGRDSVVE